MSRSVAEVTALAGRAALGSGALPAQAQAFGSAAAMHMLNGRDAEALRSALALLPAGPIRDIPLRLLDAQATPEVPVAIAWASLGTLVESYADGLSYLLVIDPEASTITACTGCSHVPSAGRITGYDALLADLEALAARTYVPESEASRAQGAGALTPETD
jgi:hypothetical protein